MSDFREALALAQLVAEKTGATVEQSLEQLAALCTGLDTTDARVAFDPTLFADRLALFQPTRPMTTKEICDALGVRLPRGSKLAGFALRRAGWVHSRETKYWEPPARHPETVAGNAR